LRDAQVIAVGPDVKLSIAPGDDVVFQKYAMAEVCPPSPVGQLDTRQLQQQTVFWCCRRLQVEIKDGEVLFVAEKSILGKLEQ
jgi:chaperonin GroES